VITVADTGVGIAPEDLPRIWDRLYRGDKSRSERGLGLGLSLVKAIVQAHGGSATVESRLGQGTTFEIRLGAETTAPAS
jgi:signal transduction histidine kinase